MSLSDHFLVFSCCGEVHDETTDSLVMGDVVRPEIVRRVCGNCR